MLRSIIPLQQGRGVNPEQSSQLEAARALDRLGQREQAVLGYRAILEQEPDHADTWAELGGLLMADGQLDLAQAACDRALALEPRNFAGLVNLACVAMHQGHLETAERGFRHAMGIEPLRSAARLLLADCLTKKGDLTQGRQILESLREEQPGNTTVLDRLNTLFVRQSDWPTLRKDLERQLVQYSGPEASYARSHLSLLFGDLPAGWEGFESRLGIPGRVLANRGFTQPRWQGAPFPGQTLLINWEQGFGDTLMFIRLVSRVKALGGRVLVEVQPPVADLVTTCPGVDAVIPQGCPLPHFDFHVGLLSLPFLFQTSLSALPGPVPYLDIPEAVPDRQAIAAVLAATVGQCRVGLCWAGNPGQAKDQRRSLQPAVLAPLAAVPGVAWHSFQFDAQELPPLPGLVVLGSLLKGFSNTAYALSGMDLVITVDTVLAHLAGALGIPTLLLLPFIPDWRWMLGRNDSPWYPSMRLYRQPTPGNWAAAVQDVVRDLAGPDA